MTPEDKRIVSTKIGRGGRIQPRVAPSPPRWLSCRPRRRHSTPPRGWRCRPRSRPCPVAAVLYSSTPLSAKLFRHLVEAAEVDALGQLGQFKPWHVDFVELLRCF